MDQEHWIFTITLLVCISAFFIAAYVYCIIYQKRRALPNWYMRYSTWWFDYFYVWWGVYWLDGLIGNDNIFGKTGGFIAEPVYFWRDDVWDVVEAILVANLVVTLFAVGCYVREFTMVAVWRDRIAKPKRDLILGGGNFQIWLWAGLSGSFAASFVVIGIACGLFYWTEILLDLKSYYVVIVEYLIMSVAKDIFSMKVIHPIMHSSERWHLWHSIHHSFTDNTNAWSTMVIHPLDIIVENGSGPTILLIFKFIILSIYNMKATIPTIHLAAYIFVTITDFSVHSANPYSVVYFNPFLDWAFLSTVAHNLHHAPSEVRETWDRQYYTQWPWHHIFPEKRREDVNLYNKYFGTDFTFDLAPWTVASRISTRFSSGYHIDVGDIGDVEGSLDSPVEKKVQVNVVQQQQQTEV